MSAALSIRLNEKTGDPDLSKHPNGIDLVGTVFPLLKLGWSAAIVVTNEGLDKSSVERPWPRSEELKSLLPGRPAQISYTDQRVGAHTLAWDGTLARDCSNGEEVPLKDLVLLTAVFLTPLSPLSPDAPPRL